MVSRNYKKFALSSLLVSVFVGHASHAYATSVPASADPSRVLSEPQRKAPDFESVQPKAPAPQGRVENAPPGAEKAFFVLKVIKLDGMTAYSPLEISKIYKDDIGKEISVARLFEIMNAIQKRYLDDGYALSRVVMPTQDIAGGEVLLQVTEGYAAEVEFDGTIKQSPVLKDAIAQIASMRPLNTKKLERILLILNDLPGLNVSAILGSTKSANPPSGAVRLTLKEGQISSPWLTIGLNNHGSKFSGPFQIVTTAKQMNIISPFDELSATLSSAVPLKEMKYAGVKYQMPIFGASGANISFDATIGRTFPGSSLKDLEVKGLSKSLKTSISYPIIRQREETLRFITSFELRQSQTNLLGAELYNDRLRVISIGGTYNNADSYYGLNALELTYSQGLNIFGVDGSGSASLSRAEGLQDFHKVYASAGRVQSLPYNFDILLAFQGQYSFDPLLSSEEFGFGGGQMGRGYDPSEITGDKGVAATIEVRKNVALQKFDAVMQGYTFYDFGKVWNIDPAAKDKISAASTGIGFRMGLSSGWSADLNAAIPLTKNPENPQKYVNGHSPRILLSLQKKI